MKKLITSLLLLPFTNLCFSQASCGSPYNLGTPSSSSTCVTFTAGSGTTGSSACSGGGWGGNSHAIYYFSFCTNASNDCVDFDFNSPGGLTGNVSALLYTSGCGSVVPGITGNQGCNAGLTSGGSVSFAPTNTDGTVQTSPNTCYVLRVSVSNTPSAANPLEVCVTAKQPASNDECAGAMPIDLVPQSTDNDPDCLYSENVGNDQTHPCMSSFENTAWYQFTVMNTADVILTIDNITCAGGGAGFQIAYYTGSCGSLTYEGCAAGSGGTVTSTFTGLTSGEQVYVMIDGNAGAHCDFDISATNTIPLPVTFGELKGYREDRTNRLTWNTFSENNSSYFEIQRSEDLQNWESLGTVLAMSNSTEEVNYEFIDESPISTLNYYRLKQVDLNGYNKYYGTVSLDNSNLALAPIKTVNSLGQEVNESYRGLVFDIFKDGSSLKRYQ